jgi:hypothetical protein
VEGFGQSHRAATRYPVVSLVNPSRQPIVTSVVDPKTPNYRKYLTDGDVTRVALKLEVRLAITCPPRRLENFRNEQIIDSMHNVEHAVGNRAEF